MRKYGPKSEGTEIMASNAKKVSIGKQTRTKDT